MVKDNYQNEVCQKNGSIMKRAEARLYRLPNFEMTMDEQQDEINLEIILMKR